MPRGHFIENGKKAYREDNIHLLKMISERYLLNKGEVKQLKNIALDIVEQTSSMHEAKFLLGIIHKGTW